MERGPAVTPAGGAAWQQPSLELGSFTITHPAGTPGALEASHSLGLGACSSWESNVALGDTVSLGFPVPLLWVGSEGAGFPWSRVWSVSGNPIQPGMAVSSPLLLLLA